MAKDEDDDLTPTEARDFVMARAAACRAYIGAAAEALDEFLLDFVSPDQDQKLDERKDLADTIDELLGEAARAIQASMIYLDDVDGSEGEPDLPEDDGHDPDDGEGEEEDDGDGDEDAD